MPTSMASTSLGSASVIAKICGVCSGGRSGCYYSPYQSFPTWLGRHRIELGRPIRIFQRFSTLDAISNGRAEVILGRGSFIESFPLFGYDFSNYEELFEDRLDLFSEIVSNEVVNYSGEWRASLQNPSSVRCAMT